MGREVLARDGRDPLDSIKRSESAHQFATAIGSNDRHKVQFVPKKIQTRGKNGVGLANDMRNRPHDIANGRLER